MKGGSLRQIQHLLQSPLQVHFLDNDIWHFFLSVQSFYGLEEFHVEKSLKVVFTWAALALFTHGLTELVLATVCRHLALLIQSLHRCESPFKQAFFMVHPQNVRFQNVRFQNVRFQNVGNVRFTKRQVYKTSGLQNVRFTKRQVFKTSGCKLQKTGFSV